MGRFTSLRPLSYSIVRWCWSSRSRLEIESSESVHFPSMLSKLKEIVLDAQRLAILTTLGRRVLKHWGQALIYRKS